MDDAIADGAPIGRAMLASGEDQQLVRLSDEEEATRRGDEQQERQDRSGSDGRRGEE